MPKTRSRTSRSCTRPGHEEDDEKSRAAAHLVPRDPLSAGAEGNDRIEGSASIGLPARSEAMRIHRE